MHSFLIISNDKSIHKELKKSLKKDYFVHSAKSPDEAISIFLSQEIDVVFLDIFIQSDELDKLLVFFQQEENDPVIVAIVPADQPTLMDEAVRIGAYEFLEKPLKAEKVRCAIRRALERQELKRELSYMQTQAYGNQQKENEKIPYEYSSYKQTDAVNLQITYKEVFQKFSKALTYVYDLKKLADLTIEAMSEIFKVGRVIFMLIDREDGMCKPFRSLGIQDSTAQSMCFSVHGGIVLWLSKNHQILKKDVLEKKVITNNFTKRESIRIQKEIALLQAQLCIPIFVSGNLIGVIALGNKITGKEFFDEDIELLTMLSRYIGMAVENAFLYKEVYMRKIHNDNVLENIPCGVIVIDNNKKVNIFNKSAAMLLKITAHDVLGRDVKCIGSVFVDIILRTLKEKKTYVMHEIEHPTTHSTYTVSTSLLLDDAKELGAIMVFSDISEVKKLASRVKVLEKQAFYHMLSKNMSHYIKNHLVAVKTFVDLFPQKQGEKEFAMQFFPVAQNEVHKLDLMVNKLTILGDNDGIMKRKVDVRIPLDQSLSAFMDNMNKHKIKIIKQYTTDVTLTYADCEKLQEAFSNLIQNAIDAMHDSGTLTVKLSSILLNDNKLREVCRASNTWKSFDRQHNKNGQRDTSKNYTEVVIQDMGSGIDPEEAQNIFLPFYTTKTHNIGLGLSIVQRIVEEYDGFIYFSTQERKGSSFHILLPSLMTYEDDISGR